MGALDLALCRFKLAATQQRRRARQTSAGSVGDGDDHR
jgi:hypothetical protein